MNADVTSNQSTMTCAELLIRLLRDTYGVRALFGIPGVHTVELYRGLEGSDVQHITPRHEQGAGFMADGYARASGQPGVCLIITGLGMTNIATAMGQALADSIPMLVISSVNRRDTLGMGQGRLHELPSQQHMISGVARFSHTLLDANTLPEVLARALLSSTGHGQARCISKSPSTCLMRRSRCRLAGMRPRFTGPHLTQKGLPKPPVCYMRRNSPWCY
ncbi:hypothetical protein HORIV_59950 [Vreelandella olivaria]|uniref:Thiamine pyrophosphate enzyme N-terminal TPP-binding domain-containing protein n=1 Tax=Vreelandella olivaria TaxID=390919 RepID=A0ABN5X2W0_9GAMM|nr:hypothetical protein HORIV_59950 [Halomonas olivaria]